MKLSNRGEAKISDYEMYQIIRDKWRSEDNLLNNRTAFFLIASGIFFAASHQGTNDLFFNFGISIIGLFISIFWRLVSNRTHNIIRAYSQISDILNPQIEKNISFYRSLHYKELINVSCNRIIAKWLPYTILISWIVYMIFTLLKYFQIL